MEDIVIVSAARTAVGKFGGSLAGIAATELGAIVIKEVIARANLTPSLMRISQASYSAPAWPSASSSSSITVTFTPLGVASE